MQFPSSKWLIGIIIVVITLIISNLTLVLVNHNDTTPESQPEGILQRYIRSIQNHDYNLAHTYLSTNLKDTCTVDQIRTESRWFAGQSQAPRMVVLGTEPLGDSKVNIRVSVTSVAVVPLLGVVEEDFEEWYVLIREGERWYLDEPPWPVERCQSLEK